jgi:hypothetical protein
MAAEAGIWEFIRLRRPGSAPITRKYGCGSGPRLCNYSIILFRGKTNESVETFKPDYCATGM